MPVVADVEEQRFTVVPKCSCDQQLTVERRDPRGVDFELGDIVVKTIFMDLQLDE